jgi:hypothetical protein
MPAQGNVVRAMSASYGKSQYSTLRRTKPLNLQGMIDYVDDVNRCANFHCNRLDKGPHTNVKYNDLMTFLF